jgi:chromosome segregation ATPase
MVGRNVYDANSQKPKVFAHLWTQTSDVNQKVFYSNTVMEGIESRLDQLQHTITTHNHFHNTISNQVKKQESATRNLETMHENLKRLVDQKGNIQQELVTKLQKYETQKQSITQQLLEIAESKQVLTERLDTLEKAEQDIYVELNDQSNRIQEQELVCEQVKSDLSGQKERNDEMVQQFNLQEIDYGDLLQKVKEKEHVQKQVQNKLNELEELTTNLALQHRDQENMHLDLFTQLIKLKSITAEEANHIKQSIAKLKSEIKQLQEKEQSVY